MSKLLYQAQRGMADQLPSEIGRWQFLQSTFANLVSLWGYEEIRTPILEDRDLFVRSSGDTSEVVSKQMYDFVDKGGRDVALRPEGTAGVMRACLEHGLIQQSQITRLWYFNQHFRYERPQKGRMRQHHQLGMELIGSSSPIADAEIIEVSVEFFRLIGLGDLKVLVNCIGRADTRARFREAVLNHIDAWLKDQPEEQAAKASSNPLRLFDSKDPGIQALMADAPLITDFLEDASRAHFDGVLARLSEAEVNFEVDPRTVRGLDYYTDTVFEIQSTNLGSQSSVCGGGRYDKLIEQIGGPSTPSVGVGIGVERVMIILDALGVTAPPSKGAIYVAAMNDEGRSAARVLAAEIRKSGRRALYDLDGKGIKQQFKQADRWGAELVFILGEDELAKGEVTIKNMQTSEQSTVSRSAALAVAGL